MSRLLIRYAKEGRVRFLSHLEVAKVLERALRRAAFPLAISGGYHPKPRLSYGPALSLGASSTSEYVVVFLEEEIPLELVKSKLSRELPEGLRLMDAEYIPDGAPSIGRIAKVASYDVFISTNRELTEKEVSASIAWLFKQDKLVVEKESGVKQVKRSEAVLDIAGEPVEGGVDFEFLLSVGGSESVRPDSLGALIVGNLSIEITGVEIERTGLFALVDGRPVDVMEYYRRADTGF
ncbi:MAG: TIGR03936 family radical SAM-associated protein [Actinobacteria bacterium]|nr:TIGR03936 family radical SAM-associated protein [Actinomycetota bacterium]